MTPEPIIEKIRALLRLAKSDNPNEAALAMQKALEIALKHRIDLTDISPDDDINRLIGDHLPTPSRLAREYKEALNIAHAWFNVNITVMMGASKALVVGTKLDIELASYVVTFLVRSCRDSLSKWKQEEKIRRRKTTGAKAQNFIQGFFWGVAARLREQRETMCAQNEGLAIVLSNGREAREEAAKGFRGKGRVTTVELARPRMDRRASLSGFLHGNKTDINPGLRGGNTTLALEG